MGSTWQTYEPVKYSSRNIRNDQRIRHRAPAPAQVGRPALHLFEDAINTAADRRGFSKAGKPAPPPGTRRGPTKIAAGAPPPPPPRAIKQARNAPVLINYPGPTPCLPPPRA